MIREALMCASLLTGLPNTPIEPLWANRLPTPAETARSVRKQHAAGVYYRAFNGVIVGTEWPVLVHEACHHLQHKSGRPMTEPPCEQAQARAWECNPATEGG